MKRHASVRVTAEATEPFDMPKLCATPLKAKIMMKKSNASSVQPR